ncbi:MAG: dynamin family protein [Peptostreptococcaceae bacterium]
MNKAIQMRTESTKDLITIEYNEFLPKTQILINGNPIKQNSELYKFTQEKLNCWVDEVVVLLTDEINNDEFDIEFIGSQPYFYDLKEVCERFSGIDVYYNESIKKPDNSDKITKLKGLVEFMQTGLIEELKDKKILTNYERAINSEFEIAIIATMSSGKSTLINAMLGTEIIPSKNEACTAKICRIKNNKNKKNFSVKGFNKSGEEILSEENINKDILSELNDDDNTFITEVEGNICNIEDGSMNLVLIDTPGPNNSQDKRHEEKTMNIIKDTENKPLVLYIINATQIGVNDDNTLLRIIRDEIDGKDKQSRDRFIFVLNKIDQIDSEKESVEGIIENTKRYLEDNGIINPNIYPASSYIAKNIRQSLNGEEVTRKEQRSFYDVEDLDLLQYVPLSDSCKNELQQEIDLCIKNRDEERELLYYTGIPYIEKAINEYLEKYAVSFKVQQAVDSFKSIINKKNIETNLIKNIEDTSTKVKEKSDILVSTYNDIKSNENNLVSNKNDVKKANKELMKVAENLKNTTGDSNLINENLEKLSKSEEERKSRLDNIKKQIEQKKLEADAINSVIKNKDSDAIIKKVNAIASEDQTHLYSRKLKAKSNKLMLEASRSIGFEGRVKLNDGKKIIKNLQNNVDNAILDIKTDLERYSDKTITSISRKLMDEYKNQIRGLFEDNSKIDIGSNSIQFIMNSMPNTNDLIREYKYEEEVVVGTETVRNESKRWWNPFTWSEPKYYERKKYENQEFIDISDLKDEYLTEVRILLSTNINEYEKHINDKISSIKKDFIEKIKNFDVVLEKESKKYIDLIKQVEKQQKNEQKEAQKLESILTLKNENSKKQEKLELMKKKLKEKNNMLKENEVKFKEEIKTLENELEIQKQKMDLENKELENLKLLNKESKDKKEFMDQVNKKLDEIFSV